MTIYLLLFLAGLLTILLPSILPLVPIVLGISLSGHRKTRTLVALLGMVVGFVLFTFLGQLLLRRLVHAAEVVGIAAVYALLLFGIGLLMEHRRPRVGLAILGALLFFHNQSWLVLLVAPLLGATAMVVAARIATRRQAPGAHAPEVETDREQESLYAPLILGLTMGLVWIPHAGPAFGFALSLVRDEHGPRAFLALTCYVAGAATPLWALGYAGQRIARSALRSPGHSRRLRQVAAGLLVFSAIALHFQLFTRTEAWLALHAGYGRLNHRS